MPKKKSKQGFNLKKGQMDGDWGRSKANNSLYRSRAKTGIPYRGTVYGSRKGIKKYKPRKKA